MRWGVRTRVARDVTGPLPAGAATGAGLPDEAAARGLATAVDEVLAALDQLADRVTAGDAAVRTARRDRAVAAGAATAVREELAAATADLRTARDPLVPFGAPAVAGEDVLAGWTALVGWARTEAAARDQALPGARAAATAAETALDAAEQQLRAAERATRDRRAEETAAARAEQEARDAVAALERRVRELREALAGAPTDAQAAAELARRDELESAAAAADAELRAARAELRSTERAAAEVAREVGSAWTTLRAARDPLVPLDAPALPDDDLRAAWSTLTDWASSRAAAGDDRVAAADAAARAAERDRVAVAGRISADLAAHGLSAQVRAGQGLAGQGVAGRGPAKGQGVAGQGVAADGSLAEVALSTVAAALERARGAQQRLVERRGAAARIVADRDAAESAQQVAKMLGGLLRSDGFPRWLVASALDALVADASASLVVLSGGQFELTHDERRVPGGRPRRRRRARPVKTLSGGETFQASLALALALSASCPGWPRRAPPGSSRSSWTRGSAPWTRRTWRSSRAPWRTWRPAATGWSA